MRLFSTEQVSQYHPDKVCDIISDAVLDACLYQDKNAHVACETLFKGTTIVLAGEITTTAKITAEEYKSIARRVAIEHGYDVEDVIVLLRTQSPEIFGGVGAGEGQGAGDQGMMFGYAFDETPERLPYGFAMANRIIRTLESKVGTILNGDAKCQITVDLDSDVGLGAIQTVLISACHSNRFDVEEVRRFIKNAIREDHGIEESERLKLIINPAGAWTLGGPAADCGLTGRKIVCDQYGGYCAVGGGAFSGKDPSKVDRSAAYMARALACHYLDENPGMESCLVQIAYAIGQAEPVSVLAKCQMHDAKWNDTYSEKVAADIKKNYDLRPYAIAQTLDLLKPQYEEIARGCHYRKDYWRV